jgi:isoleucyl-tRNA synthetase
MYAKSGSGETGIVTKELIESVKSMIVKEGSADFWWTDKYDQELIKAAGVDPTKFSAKSKDIFDIWFDSGCSFNSVLGKTF